MLKLPVLSARGKKIDEVELNSQIFECEVNEPLLHQVIRSQCAAMRSGTASTKTRNEVRGGGAKPRRQKGTGRARAGTIRSPLWRGGGVVFGPKPRDYSFSVPKKVKKLALKSALSAKARDSELIILDHFKLKQPKTKEAVKVLKNLKITKKTTVVVTERNEEVNRAIRNISYVRVIEVSEVNPYNVLDNDVLILTRDALNRLTEVLQ
ncbi:MAG: 50S ribosomal protein L4 [Actinomycetota bacterium]|nr:50S ribosomal protein L4 [Actinomycetota bacterium]